MKLRPLFPLFVLVFLVLGMGWISTATWAHECPEAARPPAVLGASVEDALKRGVTAWWPRAWVVRRGGIEGWCRLSAQIATESRWQTDARSPAGARGAPQFMPRTWQQVRVQAGLARTADIEDPIAGARAAAYYMGWLFQRGLLADDEWRGALAGYNAGPSRVRRAVRDSRLAGRAGLTWMHIAPYLAQETRAYVPRVEAMASGRS